MRRITAAVGVVLVLTAACGSGDESARGSGSPLLRQDGDLLVRCGDDVAFPLAVMSTGLDVASLDAESVAAGLRPVLRSFDVPAEDQAWKVLVAEPLADPTMLSLAVGQWSRDTGPVGEFALYARLQRAGGDWRATNWGTCNLEPALDDGSSWAHLALAAGATTSSTSLVLRVTEWECTSARDPSAYLHEPYVESTDDAVTVYWTTDTPTGNQDCPGNPAVQRSIELAEPLGERAIYDGSVWPPRALR